MTEINCVIIDDERLARVELKALLSEIGGCVVVAQAASVNAAIPLIENLKPELIFLDINMPRNNGFDLLAKLEDCPLVVFVTAYEQYAIKAFEVQAIDYLLKPVLSKRLKATLELVRQRLTTSSEKGRQVFLPTTYGGRLLDLEEVYLVRAYDHYLKLYHSKGMDLLHRSLSIFEKQLPANIFFRANRSTIVRVDAIEHIRHLSRGRYEFMMPKQEIVVVSEKRAVLWRKTF